MQVQIGGEVIEVPERLASTVRWLVIEAAQAVQNQGPGDSFKLVVHLGRQGTEPHTVIEKYQTLRR